MTFHPPWYCVSGELEYFGRIEYLCYSMFQELTYNSDANLIAIF